MSTPKGAPIETSEPVVATDIAEYHPIAGAIADLRSRYGGVLYDVQSPAGLAECRKARAEVRKHRTTLESVRQQIKAPALDLCRRIDADAKAITAALLDIEDPLDEQVKREERRREEERRAEQEKQAGYRRTVESINQWPLLCIGSTAEDIRGAIRLLREKATPDLPPHYHHEAEIAKARAFQTLHDMLDTRIAFEVEQERLAARQAAEDKRLQEERQRLEAERAEAERRAAAERAELDRQHAEHARIERQLAEERARLAPQSPPGLWPGSEPSAAPWEAAPPSQPSEDIPSEPQTEARTVMRVRYDKRGGHYHCRVFTARKGETFAKSGELYFDEDEWPDIPLLMGGAEFVEEAAEWP